MTARTIDTRPDLRTRAGEIHRPSLALLTRVELRKIVDTRSGQALLALTLLLSFGVLGYLVAQGAADGLSYSGWARDASYPVIALLPVLGVLAMASEWTQRTVLTTFTQTPRRLRVLTAKLLAAMTVGLVAIAVVDLAAAGALVVRGMILDAHVSWTGLASVLGGSAVAAALALVMGAALGALIMQTAAAIVAYFVAPNVVLLAVATLSPDNGRWVDVNEAFGWLSRFDLSGHVGPALTALGLWVALPLAIGLWRSVRRNVS
jgi:ABC-type transport system involved in multi-copper enzyme maturation permease subunit